MSEYHIVKNENGQMKVVSYEQLEKEIVKEKMTAIHQDLKEVRDKLDEIEQKYYNMVKIVPMTLADAIRLEISKKSVFKPREIIDKLKPDYAGAYAVESISNQTFVIVKRMLDSEVLIRKEDVSYFNKQYKDVEVSKDEDDDIDDSAGMDSASMPMEGQQ